MKMSKITKETIQPQSRALGIARDLNPFYHLKIRNLKRSFKTPCVNDLIQHNETNTRKDISADLIIPIYNGSNKLRNLLNSLSKNGWGSARLWLVDDASTDPAINDLLKEFTLKHPSAKIIKNNSNLGFIGSVNKAMDRTTGHVVILNSDTIVPENWIQRLLTPIIEDPSIGSATPFTNAGQICSFPNLITDTELDVNDVDRYDLAFSSMSLLNPPLPLPTGVGFCMALNRKAIDTIGGFDEAFGKGYGEENDWCMRALYRGFRSVLVNNLFVYHAHGGSFAPSEKNALLQRNGRLRSKLHRRYNSIVEKFIALDPAHLIRAIAQFKINSSGAPIELIIDHNLGGGANAYTRDQIKRGLANGKSYAVYGENSRRAFLELHTPHSSSALNSLATDQITPIINIIKPNQVTYNSLVKSKNPLKIVRDVHKARQNIKFKLLVLMHDFFPICPSYTLINNKGIYCGVPESIKICTRCLPKTSDLHAAFKPKNAIISEWREQWGLLLSDSDEVRCFSKSSATITQKAYPSIAKKITIVPHTCPTEISFKPKPTNINTSKIAIIGGINYCKGLALLKEIEEIIHKNEIALDFVIIGNTDPKIKLRHTKILGKYNSNDLPEILERENVGVVFISSIWPETFSYVTAEAMAMDVPIYCLPLGAPAERIKTYNKGKIGTSMNPDVIINEIIAFRESLQQPRLN